MEMLYRLTEEEYEEILAFKRDLHMHPELSGEEYETTGKLRAFFEARADYEILPLPVETGLVVRIRGGQEGPEIMLRADIDALPQEEDYESEWKSRVPGVMHACGHDFHTASLLGAAMLLSRAKAQGRLRGCVDLVFQPAEEGTLGARKLIGAGLFDLIRPRAVFGMHNWPSVETGKAVCHQGPLMSAKCNFEIVLHGAGGHGSMPHLNIDPIVCSAALIQSLQTVISRNTNPLDSAILSINMIQGGSPVNLVVERVMMRGTVRSLSEKALDRAIERMKTIVEKTAEAYECRQEIIWNKRIPMVFNTPEMTAFARKAACAAGCTVTDVPPSLASEDFALYRQYAPSFFYWVGSRAPGDAVEELHRPRFHTDDSALYHSSALYAASVLEFEEKP